MNEKQPVLSEEDEFEIKCPHCGNEAYVNVTRPEYNIKLKCMEQVDSCVICGGRWIVRWRIYEVKALVEADIK
jgi:transcription elongation factor Elf1